MSGAVIRCEALGKRYDLGGQRPGASLRDAVSGSIAAVRRSIGVGTGRGPAARGDSDRSIWALRDVSFEISAGEVIGVIGRNGAGKSTLLKLLSRITEPTEGRAVVRGRIGSLLEVGTGFHGDLTGRENVYLNGVILGMRKAEIAAQFDEIVAFAGVERFIDTPVKHYSSGMQLRLAFAVAVHLDTDILLVDEVLAVGDMEFQRRCVSRMDEVSKSGRTVLFVSHNMTSVGLLCQRGILLEGGRKTFDGPIADAVTRYMDSVRQLSGEVLWDTLEAAPGDDRLRLRGVRVTADGIPAGEVDIARDFRIDVLYWNVEPDARRVISIHLHNAQGVCILTSGNIPSASLVPDPWWGRPLPAGLFCTSCTIPGGLLNDGPHTITVYVNASSTATDNILVARDVLAFEVRDTGHMRQEYTGPWMGAVRPRLGWETVQVK